MSAAWISVQLSSQAKPTIIPLPDLDSRPDYQHRLVGEREWLHHNFRKLQDAMNRPAFFGLDKEERDLLVSQSRAMKHYLAYLDKRISRCWPQYFD